MFERNVADNSNHETKIKWPYSAQLTPDASGLPSASSQRTLSDV